MSIYVTGFSAAAFPTVNAPQCIIYNGSIFEIVSLIIPADQVISPSSSLVVGAGVTNTLYTSATAAITVGLPLPTNTVVGTVLKFVQENANIMTVSPGSGVTLTMSTATSIATGIPGTTTRTNAVFTTTGTSATDGTSAVLECTHTDGSTVATWRQVGGSGAWN